MAADDALVRTIRNRLHEAGDPERAAGQQRYMKSALPYAGVTAPQIRGIVRPLLREHPPTSRGDWEATLLELWDKACHREEWYAAIAVARQPRAAPWRDPASLPLWHHLVTSGAWWDVVDETAAHLVGDVLLHHRRDTTPTIRDWAGAEHLWVRRTAVLSQLRHGAATDVDLLTHCLEVNVDDRSFWLRKAIGWALRERSRVDPEWVRAFVSEHPQLSGLSRREALRLLG